MSRLFVPFAACLCFVTLFACGDEDSPELLVDVLTDMRPGLEFTRARTTVGAVEGGDAPRVGEEPAALGEDAAWLAGRRVFEFPGPPVGEIRVRVELLAADGAVVAAQQRRLTYDGTTRGVSLVITRDCAGVTCPAPGGAPAQAACLAGACVDEACGPDAPDECPAPDCASDGECAVGSACTSGRCVEGRCFVVADDASCMTGQMCDPGAGCVGAIEPPDGGPADAGDVGPADASDGGAGECTGDDECPTCPNDTCVAGRCAPQPLRGFTAGGYFNCAILAPSDDAYCFGFNGEGQLGTGTPCSGDGCRVPRPERVSFSGDWMQVVGLWQHACGLDAGGAVWCWGENGDGQLGIAGGSSPVPVRVDSSEDYTRLADGIGTSTCAFRSGAMDCWGDDQWGQLGRGPSPTTNSPGAVVSSGLFTTASVGSYHACAIGDAARLYCWGRNTVIQLDIGTDVEARYDTPVQTVLDDVFTDVSTGQAHTCALFGAGTLACWGSNGRGSVGNGGTSFETGRFAHSGSWLDLSMGHDHSCAVRDDGTLWCWGENGWGQTGQPSSIGDVLSPSRVNSDADWVSVFGGGEHTCAIKEDGSVWCWGRSTAGQLGQPSTGDGTAIEEPQPVCMNPG